MNFIKANLILFLFSSQLNAVTLVYNIKIAETTKGQRSEISEEHPSIFALTSVNQFRKRKDGADESINAGLATLIYSPKDYFIRADFAFGSVKQKIGDLCFKRTQTDDLLFSGGISKKFGKNVHFTFSGLFGIPTHKDNIIDPGLQLGTGHFGLGMQTDGSYSYLTGTNRNSLIGAARFLYFLPATLRTNINNNDLKFDFDLGNVVDIFVAHQTFWKQNKVEFGYNATFGFGASILPSVNQILDQAKFIRSSFFATYAHGFVIKKHILGIIFGIAYGFDHIPKVLGYKRVLSLWATAGINF